MYTYASFVCHGGNSLMTFGMLELCSRITAPVSADTKSVFFNIKSFVKKKKRRKGEKKTQQSWLPTVGRKTGE